MRNGLLITAAFATLISLTGCWKCYECTASTEYGDVSRDVCGRKSNIQNLVRELESDTIGVGPWICK